MQKLLAEATENPLGASTPRAKLRAGTVRFADCGGNNYITITTMRQGYIVVGYARGAIANWVGMRNGKFRFWHISPKGL
jgi:hypothetical protein